MRFGIAMRNSSPDVFVLVHSAEEGAGLVEEADDFTVSELQAELERRGWCAKETADLRIAEARKAFQKRNMAYDRNEWPHCLAHLSRSRRGAVHGILFLTFWPTFDLRILHLSVLSFSRLDVSVSYMLSTLPVVTTFTRDYCQGSINKNGAATAAPFSFSSTAGCRESLGFF